MVRKLITSRFTVGAVTFVVTAIVATGVTWYLTMRHYESTYTDGLPMQAVVYANTAAKIAAGDID